MHHLLNQRRFFCNQTFAKIHSKYDCVHRVPWRIRVIGCAKPWKRNFGRHRKDRRSNFEISCCVSWCATGKWGETVCWLNLVGKMLLFLVFAVCNVARMPLIVLLGVSKVKVGLAGFAMDSMLPQHVHAISCPNFGACDTLKCDSPLLDPNIDKVMQPSGGSHSSHFTCSSIPPGRPGNKSVTFGPNLNPISHVTHSHTSNTRSP